MRRCRLLALAASVMVSVPVFAAPASAAGGEGDGPDRHVEIVPIGEKLFGRTYGEWTARWWQWAVSHPAGTSPVTDTTGERCGIGQRGRVFFLAGTPGGDVITRECTVPGDVAILLPLINAEWSVAEGECPLPTPVGGNAGLRRTLGGCAAAFMDRVTDLEVTIDGRTLRHPFRYRAVSPLFSMNPVVDNPFSIPAGRTRAVADGFWILIEDLHEGSHVINARGEATFPEFGGFVFVSEVTYMLTVVED